MTRHTLVAVAGALALGLTGTAAAQHHPESGGPAARDCRKEAPPGLRIAACNHRLAEPRLSGKQRSEALTLKGSALEQIGDHKGGLIAAYEAVAADPRNPEAYLLRASLLSAGGQHQDALRDQLAAIELDPRSPDAWSDLAYIYEDVGDYDNAFAAYDRTLALRPDDPVVLNNRCWSRAALGRDLQLAVADCDRAVALMPRSADALDTRGFLRLRMGQYELAITDLDAALTLNRRRADSFYLRSVAARRLGRTAEADSNMAYALDIDPDVADTFAHHGVRLDADPRPKGDEEPPPPR